jgi:hypothetical protein
LICSSSAIHLTTLASSWSMFKLHKVTGLDCTSCYVSQVIWNLFRVKIWWRSFSTDEESHVNVLGFSECCMFCTNVGHFLLQIWLDFWDDEPGDYQSLHLLTLRADFWAGSILQECILLLKSVSQAFFCFNSQLQALVEFQARLQLLKLCEHHDDVHLEAAFLLCNHQSIHHLWRKAKQIFMHTQEDRKSTKKVLILHMSVCLSTSHSHLLVCRSFWANKTIFKVFQRFQFEQEFPYSKNSSTSKSVPCIVVVNAHCSGPQKENRHLHSLCLFFS